MPPIRRVLTYAGIGLVVLVVLVGAGFATGVLGVPAVEAVENRFADVDDETTAVETDIVLRNPNPVGVSLGGLGIEYAIAMNGIPMANGSKAGLSVGTGRSTVPASTTLANERIPQWWYTHVDGGETTEVTVATDVSHSLLGGRSVSVPQEQTIQTDILGQFNDSATRPIDAGAPIVSDPVLYLNETAATYGENVTPERTPLDLSFRISNPKPYPYAVSEVGYEIRMNGIAVGTGSSERAYALLPRQPRTIEADTAILNQHLDEWWVSHLERDQVSNLTIDVSVVVDPEAAGVLGQQTPSIRLDGDALDYETTIETDIFGTKDSDGLPPADGDPNDAPDASDAEDGRASAPDDGDEGSGSGSGSETTTDEPTATPTQTSTDSGPDSDSGSDTGDGSNEQTQTETPTGTQTETPMETDDGILPIG